MDEYDLKALMENGGTASLGADIELYETVFVYQDVTLDLCGHTVSVVKGTSIYDMIAFDGAKKLTVTDSVGGGVLDATNAVESAICANSRGTVTITGGTVCKGKSLYGLNIDGGQIVISGGRFDFDPTSYLASGYIATAETDGYWTVTEQASGGDGGEPIPTPDDPSKVPADYDAWNDANFDGVADAGETFFENFEDAVAEGGYVKLARNITVSQTVNVDQTLTLDLNGYTLDCKSGVSDIFYLASSGASLTVRDSGSGGTIDATHASDSAVWLESGSLTLEGGSILTSKNYGVLAKADTNVTVCGGYLEQLEDEGSALLITGGCFGFDPTALVNSTLYTVVKNTDKTYTVEPILAKLTAASISIGTDLTMKYYVWMAEDAVGEGQTLAMRFTMNEKTVTVTEYSEKNGELIFAFQEIAPHYMGDLIDAELLLIGGDGTEKVIAFKRGYSVKENCTRLLNKNPNNETLRALIADLLTYGAAAQVYQNYRIGSLVDADVTEATEWVALTESKMTLDEGTSNSLYLTAAGVWFSNVNRLYFKFHAANGVENVRVTVGEKTYTASDFEACGSNVYVLYSEAITATGFDTIYTVLLFEGDGTEPVQTLTYGICSYVYAMQDSENSTMQALARALYNYGMSAKAYQNAA